VLARGGLGLHGAFTLPRYPGGMQPLPKRLHTQPANDRPAPVPPDEARARVAALIERLPDAAVRVVWELLVWLDVRPRDGGGS
jgi:hypothetical protein